MGSWGPSLYNDDVAVDVRREYKELLKSGKTDEEALQEIFSTFAEIISDPEDGPVLWFALADTMWKLGRLTPEVQQQALKHIEAGADLCRWKEQDPKQATKRKEVLEQLKAQLLSKQPERKRIPVKRYYRCQWEIGGVYAYPFVSEIAIQNGFKDQILLMQKISESEDYTKYHLLPVCRIKICHKDHIPTTKEEFDQLPYWKFVKGNGNPPNSFPADFIEADFIKKFGQENALKAFYLTSLRFLYDFAPDNTSKRAIPKSIFYVGNFGIDNIPEAGFVYEIRWSDNNYPWPFFDKLIIPVLKRINPELFASIEQ